MEQFLSIDDTILSSSSSPIFWWLSATMYDVHDFAHKVTVTSKEDALVLFVPAQVYKPIELEQSSRFVSCKEGE